ncbi:MAG: hypothetical protein ABFS32_09250 [Bacteroidota bacterium]
MMKLFLSVPFLLLLGTNLADAQTSVKVPIPTQVQLDWQNAELVALVCIDLHAFDRKKYLQRENRITSVADYNIFNPQKYDMDQWVKSLKDGGFKIAILTVSHETGFFLSK